MSLEEASRENIEHILQTITSKLTMVNQSAMEAGDFSTDHYEDLLDLYHMVRKKDQFSIREMEEIVSELGRLRKNE